MYRCGRSDMKHVGKTCFVLIPGAGGMAWYWHRVVPLLEQAHHEAIAVDLPAEDKSAGLDTYAKIVVRALGKRKDVILVAQSLGGFTAPLVCARATVRMLVLVNAMIPRPGETAGAWWENTGAVRARLAAAKRGHYTADFDVKTYFLHDVPEAVLREGPPRQSEQAEAVFGELVSSMAGRGYRSASQRQRMTAFSHSISKGASRTPGSILILKLFPEGI